MADPVTALVVGGSTLIGGAIQSRSAGRASRAQQDSAREGIDEQRRQFEALQEVLSPYVQAGRTAIGDLAPFAQAGTDALGGLQPFAQAGAPALEQQQAILGLLGPEAQRAAVAGIEQGAGFQAQVRQGEEAILQSASATGGLRGGNIQAALAQFRPQMLQREIDLQYGRLGGMADIGRVTTENLASLGQTTTQNIAQLGQASAAGTGAAGLQTGQRVAGLLGEIGAARAGGELATGQALSSAFNLPSQFLGLQYGMQGQGGGASPGFGNLFSDSRLKANIHRISTRPDGLGVYEFEYIWGGGKHIGLMAQEVLSIYPDAVGSVGGYYTVDYSRV